MLPSPALGLALIYCRVSTDRAVKKRRTFASKQLQHLPVQIIITLFQFIYFFFRLEK